MLHANGIRVSRERPMTADNLGSAAAQIRALVEAQAQAIRAKDVDGSVSGYAPDVVLFDVVDPLRSIGSGAVRQRLAAWFASFEGPIGCELLELCITAGDDVAFSHSLNRVDATTIDGGKLDMWWRQTACYRKEDGRWRVAHAHASVPFDPANGQASLGLRP